MFKSLKDKWNNGIKALGEAAKNGNGQNLYNECQEAYERAQKYYEEEKDADAEKWYERAEELDLKLEKQGLTNVQRMEMGVARSNIAVSGQAKAFAAENREPKTLKEYQLTQLEKTKKQASSQFDNVDIWEQKEVKEEKKLVELTPEELERIKNAIEADTREMIARANQTPKLVSSNRKPDHMIRNTYEDNEDCFGFHSEYYINADWHTVAYGYRVEKEEMVRKGYTRYSKYGDSVYFLPEYAHRCLVKCNIEKQQCEIIPLDTKESLGYYDKYIAVNSQGYFIYDTLAVTLYGFDGHEISTHKFGRKNHLECIYIYDKYVIYSETKQTDISNQIYRVDMLTKQMDTMWTSCKGDSGFDQMIRESYQEEWGMALPCFQTPSNIGKVTCEFLYMNGKRIIAGYTRSKMPNMLSYIINIDLATAQSSLLDCFPTGDPEKMPPKTACCIWGFDMLHDSMWVKTDDRDIRLMRASIQKKSNLSKPYQAEWSVPYKPGWGFYYLDGKRGYVRDTMNIFRFFKDGEKECVLKDFYQTMFFWGVGDLFIRPSEYRRTTFHNEKGGCVYTLTGKEEDELVQNAERAKSTVVDQPEENPKGSMAAEEAAQPEEHQELPIGMKEQVKVDQNVSVTTEEISLAELRAFFQEHSEHSEQLKEFRKSLKDDKWDFNVVMGILLGSCKRHATGSRHIQEQNAGIGQGDNKDMVVVTLNQYGLMDLYQKYEKVSGTDITVSAVMEEICERMPKLGVICDQIRMILQ